MPSTRIRGQDVEVVVLADGRAQSFTDIQSSEFTSETETSEEGYLGEKSNRYDEIYKGYSGSLDLHNSSPATLDFLKIVKDRAQRRTPGVTINVKMTLAFPSGERKRIVMSDAFFDASGVSFGGRDEYGTTTIPFKGSDWRAI